MIGAKVILNVPEYKGVAFRTVQGAAMIDALPADLRTKVVQAALEYEIYAEQAWDVIRAGLEPYLEIELLEAYGRGMNSEAIRYLTRIFQESSAEETAALLRPLCQPWHVRLVRAVEFRKWQLTSWVKRVFGARRGRNKANEGRVSRG